MHGSSKNNSQILIISPEPWQGHFVSKHHYAVTLAKQGYDIYFLNPPEDNVKDTDIEQTKYANLWEVSAPKVAKGLRFYPKFLRNYIERKWLESLENHIGKRFTSIWLFENSRFYNMDFAGERTKIYHQVDSNQNFHLKEVAYSADICFCTTDFIGRDLLQFTQKVHKIHHGVDSHQEVYHLTSKEKQVFKTKTPHIVYMGNLDIMYFDIELFVTLVSSHQEVTFHLLGGYSQDKALYRACKMFTNIQWWGRVESKYLLSILEACDVQILLYHSKNNADKEQLASPHKIMEYLASGKVTVATYTDEYKDKRELLEMVESSDDFIDKFDEVVNHLSHYNSEEKQKMRRAFAKEHSYENQLEKIKSYLKQYNLEL